MLSGSVSAKPPGGLPLPANANVVSPDSLARIAFVQKEFDAGRVPQGRIVDAEFVFTNTGTAVLEIRDVRPGCGCTATTNWDRTVEPGKVGRIPMRFDTGRFSGPVTKPTTVTCNDPTQSQIILTVKADIWRPVDIQPNFVYFSSVDPETNDTRVARIVNNTSEDLKITDLQSSNAMFKVELKELKPGREFELHVTTVPPLQGVNPQTLITARTSSTNMPEIRLTAMALVQAPVVAVPLTVMLPAGPLKAPTQYMVSVRNNRPRMPMAITEANLNLTNVTVKVHEAEGGRVFNILLGFPAQFELAPGQMGRLSITTTHPRGTNLNVNVVQMSPRPVVRPASPSPAPPAVTGSPAGATVTNAQVLR